MNLSNIDTKITELTKADSNDYPAANRLININIWNQKIVTWILASQDSSDFDDANHTGYATLSASLVSGQRDYQFGVSDSVVAIKRVDISYDGVKSYRSTPLDSSEFEMGLVEGQTDVDNLFDRVSPGHDWKYNALFIYPKPTATVGSVEVEVSRSARDFTSAEQTAGTITPGFDANFHPALAYGAAYEYFFANEMSQKAQQAADVLNDYRQSIKVQYGKKEQSYPLAFGSSLENYN